MTLNIQLHKLFHHNMSILYIIFYEMHMNCRRVPSCIIVHSKTWITHSLRAHWCWPGVSATTQQSGYKRCETKNQTHFGFVQATFKIIRNHSRLVQRSGNLWSKQYDWTWHWTCVTSSALQGQQHCPLDWATIFPGIPGSHAFPIIHRPGANATTLQSQGTSWGALPKQENLVNYINHSK